MPIDDPKFLVSIGDVFTIRMAAIVWLAQNQKNPEWQSVKDAVMRVEAEEMAATRKTK